LVDRADLQEAIRRAANPQVLVERVVDATVALLESCDGALVGLIDGDAVVVETGTGFLTNQIGIRIPLGESLSGRAIASGETLHCKDSEADGRVNLPMTREYQIRSLIVVPLYRQGEPIGVLNVTSARPHAFSERDEATLRRLARFVSVVVSASADLAATTEALLAEHGLDGGERSRTAAEMDADKRFVANVLGPGKVISLETATRIEGFITGTGIEHLFQPIYDIAHGDLFGVEALARFAGEPTRPPDQWFADAQALGCGVDLELVAVRRALGALPVLPPDIALSVNAGPITIGSDGVLEIVSASEPARVVMELTEQIQVDNYPRLAGALGRLRLVGVRLAIDDTGAGFASLAHILKLGPDLIKLDRALTSGIDLDPVRRALAEALVSFAEQTGAQIVAEGIETAEELAALKELGIPYGQGYFLGRPGPPEAIAARLSLERLAGLAATSER
jgi:EAL domain-containing protein (putative c-di-GMP-specific phosphodiesterase class I)/putative methionine-R-sulfoxide reductase with GAF domain